MDQASQARNLVHHWIVKQLGVTTDRTSIELMTAWNADPSRPLLEVFADRGLLVPEECRAIEQLADRWVERHGGDPRVALEALVRGALDRDDDRTQSLPLPTAKGDRYELRGELSHGGMGEVIVAVDRLLGREVLVKQIRPDRDGPESRAMFMRERQTAARLEHPNIVPIHDAGTHGDGRPFYVMRYIRGDTLKQAIQRFHPAPTGQTAAERSLALRALLGRFVDVCEAVAYAHEREVPVIHRDIKPGNILLGDFGETQLIDWGLARAGGEHGPEAVLPSESSAWADDSGSQPTRTGQQKGTTEYMSPEQAAGEQKRVGPLSDVYGLGATLYHILVGHTPFDRRSESVDADIRRGVFPSPRRVNPEVALALEAICLKAMACEPADRYPSAKALAADVERWLADEPVSVYRDRWPIRVARFAKRHRTAVTAAGVLVVTSVAALAVSADVFRRQRDEQERLKQVAIEQRDRAVRNADALADVIDRFLIEIADDAWSQFPGTATSRLKMARLAVDHYEDLRKQSPGDEAVLAGLGRALRRASNLCRVIDDLPTARDYFARSRQVFERLADGDPQSVERTTWLVDLLIDEVPATMHEGGPALAETLLDAAEERFDRLAGRGQPWQAARLAYERGSLLSELGRWDEAVASLRQAATIFDRHPPAAFALRALRVLVIAELASAEARAGMRGESRRTLADAEGFATALRREHSDVPDALLVAANVARIGAAIAGDDGETALANARLAAAIEIGERLVRESPSASGFRRELSRALLDRAEQDLHDDSPGSACDAADRVLELLSPSTGPAAAGTGDSTEPLVLVARAYAARGTATMRLDGPAAARPDLEAALEYWRRAKVMYPRATDIDEGADEIRELLDGIPREDRRPD
ncbi:MAG: protein kinase domain-containing protein [Planctomycetaceae bacterium]